MGCRKLETVHISESLKKIEVGLLARCRKLKKIEIPDSVEVICNGAFAECSGCATFCMRNKNVRIGVRVFEGCDILLNDIRFVESMKKHLENTEGEK